MSAIPIEVLKSVRRIITHKGCPDGVASAMILHDCLPEAEVVFCRYGSPELSALKPQQGDLFCDFTPPRDRVDEWLQFSDTVVLDHHETQKDLVTGFRYGVYSDESGVSGAVLAYREVWYRLHEEEPDVCADRSAMIKVRDFSRLAGVRDTWQTHSRLWPKSCEQAAALMFWPTDQLLFMSPDEWLTSAGIGELLVRKNQERLLNLYRGAYRIQSPVADGVVLCVECSGEISDLAELVKVEDTTVSVVVGFHYFADVGRPTDAGGLPVPRMKVSLRSRLGVDVSVIAAKYGGGGHKFAAGFVIPAPVGMGPYEFIKGLFVGVLP